MRNYQTEEKFHDEWARSTPVESLNVVAMFQGATTPEYKKAIELLSKIKGKKILNPGCGLGEEAVYLAIKGAKVTALDISEEMLKITRKLAKRYKVEKNIVFKKMSIEDMKFKDNTFDAVFGCNVLHHVNIKKTMKEIRRVLKPGSKSVFVEPLAYNPAINVYRKMAYKVRTDHEHPLTDKDINLVKKIFPKTSHLEFHFFTLLIFVWFYLFERQDPNNVRYWKKIINDSKKYEKPFKVLKWIDNFFITLFPFFRKYCWITVIKSEK